MVSVSVTECFVLPVAWLCHGACVEVDSDTEAVLGKGFKLGCISCKMRGEVPASATVHWWFMAKGESEFVHVSMRPKTRHYSFTSHYWSQAAHDALPKLMCSCFYCPRAIVQLHACVKCSKQSMHLNYFLGIKTTSKPKKQILKCCVFNAKPGSCIFLWLSLWSEVNYC